jgi:hypothetical protein
MRRWLSRSSDWVVSHPVLWSVGLGLVLVTVGVSLDLSPVLIVAAGTVLGLLNLVHARRRGYCPVPRGSAPPRGVRGLGSRS